MKDDFLTYADIPGLDNEEESDEFETPSLIPPTLPTGGNLGLLAPPEIVPTEIPTGLQRRVSLEKPVSTGAETTGIIETEPGKFTNIYPEPIQAEPGLPKPEPQFAEIPDISPGEPTVHEEFISDMDALNEIRQKEYAPYGQTRETQYDHSGMLAPSTIIQPFVRLQKSFDPNDPTTWKETNKSPEQIEAEWAGIIPRKTGIGEELVKGGFRGAAEMFSFSAGVLGIIGEATRWEGLEKFGQAVSQELNRGITGRLAPQIGDIRQIGSTDGVFEDTAKFIAGLVGEQAPIFLGFLGLGAIVGTALKLTMGVTGVTRAIANIAASRAWQSGVTLRGALTAGETTVGHLIGQAGMGLSSTIMESGIIASEQYANNQKALTWNLLWAIPAGLADVFTGWRVAKRLDIFGLSMAGTIRKQGTQVAKKTWKKQFKNVLGWFSSEAFPESAQEFMEQFGTGNYKVDYETLWRATNAFIAGGLIGTMIAPTMSFFETAPGASKDANGKEFPGQDMIPLQHKFETALAGIKEAVSGEIAKQQIPAWKKISVPKEVLGPWETFWQQAQMAEKKPGEIQKLWDEHLGKKIEQPVTPEEMVRVWGNAFSGIEGIKGVDFVILNEIATADIREPADIKKLSPEAQEAWNAVWLTTMREAYDDHLDDYYNGYEKTLRGLVEGTEEKDIQDISDWYHEKVLGLNPEFAYQNIGKMANVAYFAHRNNVVQLMNKPLSFIKSATIVGRDFVLYDQFGGKLLCQYAYERGTGKEFLPVRYTDSQGKSFTTPVEIVDALRPVIRMWQTMREAALFRTTAVEPPPLLLPGETGLPYLSWDRISDDEKNFWYQHVGGGNAETADKKWVQSMFTSFDGDFMRASPGSVAHAEWKRIRGKQQFKPTKKGMPFPRARRAIPGIVSAEPIPVQEYDFSENFHRQKVEAIKRDIKNGKRPEVTVKAGDNHEPLITDGIHSWKAYQELDIPPKYDYINPWMLKSYSQIAIDTGKGLTKGEIVDLWKERQELLKTTITEENFEDVTNHIQYLKEIVEGYLGGKSMFEVDIERALGLKPDLGPGGIFARRGIDPVDPPELNLPTREQIIASAPKGMETNQPNLTYRDGEAQTKNVWVRQTTGRENKGRPLLVQFSTNLINPVEQSTGLDKEYYDLLYNTLIDRGYQRPTDFWEIPQWIGVISNSLPNADVYVVRDIEEAIRFFNEADYGTIAFSALDVNKDFISRIAEGYEGDIAVGGYVKLKETFGRFKHVKTYDSVQPFIESQGFKFMPGTNYRHFAGTEVIPRLTMSTGCRYKCLFCTVERGIKEVTWTNIKRQLESLRGLKYRFIYLNDKTFGQSPNYAKLPEIYKMLRADNPDFEGFVIQTTATEFMNIPSEFLVKSGIRYVEIGVESFNNDILREYRKPHRTDDITSAFMKIRKLNMLAVPNLIIGGRGENDVTYGNTKNFLESNRDIISHMNIYNLAVYPGTELAETIGPVEPIDYNENELRKSWMKNPQMHHDFADSLYRMGIEQLKIPRGELRARFAPARAKLEGFIPAAIVITPDGVSISSEGEIPHSGDIFPVIPGYWNTDTKAFFDDDMMERHQKGEDVVSVTQDEIEGYHINGKPTGEGFLPYFAGLQSRRKPMAKKDLSKHLTTQFIGQRVKGTHWEIGNFIGEVESVDAEAIINTPTGPSRGVIRVGLGNRGLVEMPFGTVQRLEKGEMPPMQPSEETIKEMEDFEKTEREKRLERDYFRFGDPDVDFRKPTTRQIEEGMRMQDIQLIADDVMLKVNTGAVDILAVQNWEEINEEERIRLAVNGMKSTDKAIFDSHPTTGKPVIILMADNLVNEADVVQTMFHELFGHVGFEIFMGKGRLQWVVDEVHRLYTPEDLRSIYAAYEANPDDEGGQYLVAMEKISEIAETGENPGLWRRFVAWLKLQIHDIFGTVYKPHLTENDIKAFLWRSRQIMHSITPLDVQKAFKNSVQSGWDETLPIGPLQIAANRRTNMSHRDAGTNHVGWRTQIDARMNKDKNFAKKLFKDIGAPEIIGFLPFWLGEKNPNFKDILNVEWDRQDKRNRDRLYLLRSPFNDTGDCEYLLLKSTEGVDKLVIWSDLNDYYLSDEQDLQSKSRELLHRSLTKEEVLAYHAWKKAFDRAADFAITKLRTIALRLHQNQVWYPQLERVILQGADVDEVALTLDEATAKEFKVAAERTKSRMDRIAEREKSLKAMKFYSPHVRGKGDYVVRVYEYDPAAISEKNPKGRVKMWVERFDNKTDAELARVRLSRIFKDAKEVEKTFEPGIDEFVYGAGYTQEAIEALLGKAVERGERAGRITEEQADMLMENVLASVDDIIAARGFRQHYIRRHRGPEGMYIGGYQTKDLKKVFMDYMSGLAGSMSKLEATYDFHHGLRSIKYSEQPELYQYAVRYAHDMLRNSDKLDRQINAYKVIPYCWYLSMNLRLAVTQLFQNAVTAYPILARLQKEAGVKGSAGLRLGQAMKDIVAYHIDKNALPADELAMLKEAYEEGETMAKAIQTLKGNVEKGWGKKYFMRIVDAASLPFAGMERFNRESSLLAAYRMYKEAGSPKEVAYQLSKDFIRMAHYAYGFSNFPQLLRDGTAFAKIMGLGYVFKSFPHNYVLSMLHFAKDKEGKLALGVMFRSLVMIALLGGMTALPFIDDLLEAYEKLTGHYVRSEVRAGLKKVGGDLFSDIGMEGLPVLAGLDMSGTVKMQIPIPIPGITDWDPGTFTMGVWGGLLEKSTKMLEYAVDGKFARALEAGSPVGVEMMLKGARMGRVGLRTSGERPILDEKGKPIYPTGFEVGAHFAGFRPHRIAKVQKERRTAALVKEHYARQRQELRRNLRIAMAESDKDELARISRKIQAYNLRIRKFKGVIPPFRRGRNLLAPEKGYTESRRLFEEEED